MYEFLKIFLSGERVDRYRRAQRLTTVCRLLLFLSACVPYIVIMARGENMLPKGLVIALVCLVGVFGVLDLVASYRQTSLAYMLTEEQHEANLREYTGEALSTREKLYSVFLQVYAARRKSAFWEEQIYRVTSLLPLLASEIFYGLFSQNEDARVYMTLVFLLCALLIGVFGSVTAKKALKQQSEFYDAAQAEIEQIKREGGVRKQAIVRAEERAKAGGGRNPIIELFLKEPEEREGVRKAQTKSGIGAVLLMIGFVALLSAFLPKEGEQSGTVSYVLIAISMPLLLLGLILVIFSSLEQRQVFYRNERKLTQSEGDVLRRDLQGKFMKMQKISSIFMLSIVLCGAALGVALAFLGMKFAAERGESYVFSEQLFGCLYACVLYACLLSLIVFTVVFIVYRKKTKGEEAALRNCIAKEREFERTK